ncbi:MAG: alpha/beta fold hydrolase [Anaerolineae bacterium]|nr:alpha/beta hydrolase [Ardenticatenia bacterium]MBK8539149.1 alpha/beta hydrolase [Ardenticatenia bacterium]HQZ70352.1 alpha/beta hydrolase [Anaerolineae bacterium]HRA19979.1 alpha/beta hydrolase [Anaerolineae bacterium]
MKRVHRWAATLAGIGIAALVVVGVLMRLMDGMFEEGQGIRDLEDAGLKRRSIAGPKGLTLSYFQTGDPALGRVVYCHGTPGDANAWSRYLLEPVGGMGSVTYDRPGFGQTAPLRALPGLADQAAAMVPFLLDPGPKPILVGHSLGGPIIVRAALDYPELVGGLVIAAGDLDPDLEKWMWYNRLADTGLARLVIPSTMTRSNDELKPIKADLLEMSGRLGTLQVPVILIHSTDDSLVPYANVDFMQRRFPIGAIRRVDTFTDKDHFVVWNAAETVRAAIQELSDLVDGSQMGGESGG